MPGKKKTKRLKEDIQNSSKANNASEGDESEL